jgi:hypothetical protein
MLLPGCTVGEMRNPVPVMKRWFEEKIDMRDYNKIEPKMTDDRCMPRLQI